MKHISYDQVVEAVEYTYNVESFTHQGDKLVMYFDGIDELAEIQFRIVGDQEHKSAQGCHTWPEDMSDLTHSLSMQVEDCLRDGFTTIYIHKAA